MGSGGKRRKNDAMLWDAVTGRSLSRIEGWDVVSLQKKSKSTPGREKLEAGVDRYVRS